MQTYEATERQFDNPASDTEPTCTGTDLELGFTPQVVGSFRVSGFPSFHLDKGNISTEAQPQTVNLRHFLRAEAATIRKNAKQLDFWNASRIWKESISAKLHEVHEHELASDLDQCHDTQTWASCNQCRKKRSFWNRCDRNYCPMCQPKLARERAESVDWWTREIVQPKHLVLTARNSTQISKERVKWFKNCIAKLRRRKCAKNWIGGMWNIECTNEGKGWHLHAHLLIECKFVDLPSVREAWSELVGQDLAIIWVRDCRNTQYLTEVTKYAVKGSQLATWTGTDIASFIRAFQNEKCFGVFGSLFGKRTEFSAWIESRAEKGVTCECGCKQWTLCTGESHEVDEKLELLRESKYIR